MTNRDIEDGAKAIARDLLLPGGRQKKLARLVADHLPWFDAAEARGMTWEDLVAVLSLAGVTGPKGRPLTVGSLSSAVWRKRHQVQPARRAARSPEPVAKSPPQPGRSRMARSRKEFGKDARPAPRPALPSQHEANPAASGNATLEFMRRAARMRRGSNE